MCSDYCDHRGVSWWLPGGVSGDASNHRCDGYLRYPGLEFQGLDSQAIKFLESR